MSLSDCSVQSSGTVIEIGGGARTHRRLVDLGLLGCSYRVRAKTKQSMLVDFNGVSAVIALDVAEKITVTDGAK